MSNATQTPVLCNQVLAVIEYLNEDFANYFQLEYRGRMTAVEITALDGQMILSSVEPLRPQLVAELRRVSALCRHMADIVDDGEWCDAERDADETHQLIITDAA